MVISAFFSFNPDGKDGEGRKSLGSIFFMLKKHCMSLRLFPRINPDVIDGKVRNSLDLFISCSEGRIPSYFVLQHKL